MRHPRIAGLITAVLMLQAARGSDLPPRDPSLEDRVLEGVAAALEAGDPATAELEYRVLLETVDRGTRDDPRLVDVLIGLATARMLQGDGGESRALFGRALRIERIAAAPDPRRRAAALHGLSRSMLLLGQPVLAGTLLREELTLREPFAEDEPLALARVLRGLAGLGRGPASALSRETELYEQALSHGSMQTPGFLEQAARDAERRVPAARLHLLRATALVAETRWRDRSALAEALRGIARAYRAAGSAQDARAWFERAWDTRPPRHFQRAIDAYRVYPDRKALAFALDAAGRWTYGFFTGEPTREQAVTKALAECRRRLPSLRIDADCRIYALDDEIVWQP